MSTSSSAPARSVILRGPEANRVSLARMDADLRISPYANESATDPRLVDPVLAKAFDEAVSAAEAQAREEGFRRGYAEGLEAAEREKRAILDQELALIRGAEQARDEKLRQALAILDQAAAAAAERQAIGLAGIEELLLDAALDLATTLLGRELEIADAPVRDAVRRALTVLPTDIPATLYLHPVDHAALGDVDALFAARPVRIVADPDVEPGSCIADGGPTHVDASLSAAIERVKQVLAS